MITHRNVGRMRLTGGTTDPAEQSDTSDDTIIIKSTYTYYIILYSLYDKLITLIRRLFILYCIKKYVIGTYTVVCSHSDLPLNDEPQFELHDLGLKCNF